MQTGDVVHADWWTLACIKIIALLSCVSFGTPGCTTYLHRKMPEATKVRDASDRGTPNCYTSVLLCDAARDAASV